MKFLHRPVQDFEGITRNFEQLEEQGMFVASGAPAFSAQPGNYYFRTDTPTTANQRIYVCTDGTTWVGIL